MILELIVALLVGILAGTLTGLTPGIHINLISVMLLSYVYTSTNSFPPTLFAVFIISMAVTHTFVDFIPSIFLGAPEEDSFLSILPGHQLLLEGKGYDAVVYTAYGSIIALFIILLLTPLFLGFLPSFYSLIQKSIGIILILVSLFLILSEEKKLASLIIFILSGFLGIASLTLNIKEPLLPLLTGLFGASTLIISIKQKTKIPEQKIMPIKYIILNKTDMVKGFCASVFSAPFTSFLPGLGSSQSAIIGKQLFNIKDQKQFLFLLGAINTIVMGLSFITLYSINKTRTGAAVAVSKLMPELTTSNLILILTIIISSGIISFFLTIALAKFTAKNINKIKYEKLSFFIIIFLIIVIFLFSDFTIQGKIIALTVFITSTSLGIFTILSGIKRIHLMGALIIPTILFHVF